jgi:deazaflavin-dependent oxidoreductase (nitroreductase family)
MYISRITTWEMVFSSSLLLLTTTGAKSGKLFVTPLAYVTDGDRLVVIASKAGAPTNPDWYYNLLAHPTATVEVGQDRFQVQVRPVTEEPERSRLHAKMVERMPGFAEYERNTTRKIRAVVLERVNARNE